MMKETRHSNQWGIPTLLSLILGTSILFAGCGKPPPAVKKIATKVETKSPAKVAPAQKNMALLKEIKVCGDMIAWYKSRSEYLRGGTRDRDVNTAFAAKERELLEKKPAEVINNSLELVAFDWKIQGKDPGEGKNARFTITWLFRKTAPIQFAPDHDVRLILRGIPDKAHAQQYLSTKKRPDRRYFELTYALKPSLDMWPDDDYHLVTRTTIQPSILYEMITFFSSVKKIDGKWRYAGPYGPKLKLGWYVDLGV